MYGNVLVWIDDPVSAAQVLAAGVEMARASNGRLSLLTTAARPSRRISLALPPFALPVVRDRLAAQIDAEAQRRVDEYAQLVPADVPVTKLLSYRRMADALLVHTRTGPWDLVVVSLGAVGRRTPRRCIRMRVLDTSSIPVLVLQHSPNPASPPPQYPPVTDRRWRRRSGPSLD
jgi:hypothetical protein